MAHDDFSTDPTMWSTRKLLHEYAFGMPAVINEYNRREKLRIFMTQISNEKPEAIQLLNDLMLAAERVCASLNEDELHQIANAIEAAKGNEFASAMLDLSQAVQDYQS